MQAESLRLNQEQVELGTRLISESINNFAKRYPGSVCVVYIPSPSLIYKIDNFIPQTYYIKGTKDFRYSFNDHYLKSVYIRKRFTSLFKKNSTYFIDANPFLSELGSREIIHGKKDFNHFDQNDYKYLANWLYTKHNKCFN